MRLLLLTPFLPYAGATHGGGVYLHALARALRNHVEIGLVALVNPIENLQLLAERHQWSWLGTATYPGPGRSWPDRARTLWHWTHRPLVAAKCWQPALRPLLATAVAEFRPDAVLVEMAQMAQYLPLLQAVPTVLTDHEAGSPANVRTGLGPLGDRRDRRLWRRYVDKFYRHATLLQALTRTDANALQQRLQRPVAVRAPAVPVPDSCPRSQVSPPRALFLGDYRHEPNVYAARRIATEIWPLIRDQVPTAELWLAGPNEATIAALAAAPGVRVLGYQADLPQLLASVRLVLAPLWTGAGFRVKAATALAHGIPVVSNELGSRGLEGAGHALVVRENAADLAAAASAWLRDAQAAARAGAAGQAFATLQLSAAAVASQQLANLAPLLRSRP